MQPNRNAKAELNHRSQICEVLTGTGISRREKWLARRAKARTFAFGRGRLRALRFGVTAFARHCVASEGWWEVLVMLQSSSSSAVL